MKLSVPADLRGFKTRAKPWLLAGMMSLLLLPVSSAQSWVLVWSDEFNGPVGPPNRANWIYDRGGGGWGNNELEFYCAPNDTNAPCDAANPNIQLDGQGNLVIRAIKTPSGMWTSGRMKTQGLQPFQFRRIEARMKLPVGSGLWPAFWMLGTNIGSVGWPTCGEQDIMEWVPQYTPTTTSSTIHGPGYSGGNGIGRRFTFPGGGRVDDANFHVYGVIWSQDKMQFYRDDYTQPFFTVTPANIPPGKQWVYNHPFFLLLNLAVGGNFPNPGPDSTTPNPAIVLVDYVRVYEQSPTVTIGSSANPSSFGQSVTFTSTLSPATATGTIQFNDGSTNLGSGTVSNGAATLATSSLSVGTHSITAVYGGDATFVGSSSPALTQAVVSNGTTATSTTINNVVMQPAPTPGQRGATVHLGQSIVVTATVSTTTGTPTGSVALFDGNGFQLASSMSLPGTGSTQDVTFPPIKISLGAQSIVAEYFGDSTFQTSSSTASLINHTPKPR